MSDEAAQMPPPGWYPDPATRLGYRCWDGQAWTRFRSTRELLLSGPEFIRDFKSKRRRRKYPPPIEADRITLEFGLPFVSHFSDRFREAEAKHGALASMNRTTMDDIRSSCRIMLDRAGLMDENEGFLDAFPAKIRELDEQRIDAFIAQYGRDSRSVAKSSGVNRNMLEAIIVLTMHALYYVTPRLEAVTRWPWSDCRARLVRRGRVLSTEVELTTASHGELRAKMGYWSAVNLLTAAAAATRPRPPE